ncbi:MAG: iron dicitrate transport regulator FecR [Chthoniobacteraceae bacterium]|nr:iron dicitrate transport regulator FecR [Chthoniobacteraceae bacterium]
MLALAAFWPSTAPLIAATPFTQATVTRVQNAVSFGELKGKGANKRRAEISDIIRANNFLLTESDSRAELQYEDGSVVRVGQNTVFSFDASSRTLSLDKGTFIFFIPKGAGGGTIKTQSLTAAITGTVGKVSDNMIAILEGEVTILPSGDKVPAGSFARRNRNGSLTIAPFDLALANDGKLMNFNGPMPGYDQTRFVRQFTLTPRQADPLESLEIVNSSPSTIRRLFPERPQPPKPPRKEPPAPVVAQPAPPPPRPRIIIRD